MYPPSSFSHFIAREKIPGGYPGPLRKLSRVRKFTHSAVGNDMIWINKIFYLISNNRKKNKTITYSTGYTIF
jgi:hypothetical protein